MKHNIGNINMDPWGLGADRPEANGNGRDDQPQDTSTTTTPSSTMVDERAAALQQYLSTTGHYSGGHGGGSTSFLNSMPSSSQQHFEDMLLASQMGGSLLHSNSAGTGGMPSQIPYPQYNDSLLQGYGYPTSSASLPLSMLRGPHGHGPTAGMLNDSNHMGHGNMLSGLGGAAAGQNSHQSMRSNAEDLMAMSGSNMRPNAEDIMAMNSSNMRPNAGDLMAMGSSGSRDIGPFNRPNNNGVSPVVFEGSGSGGAPSNAQLYHNHNNAAMQSLQQGNRFNAEYPSSSQDIGPLLGPNNSNLFDSASALNAQAQDEISQRATNFAAMPAFHQSGRLNVDDLASMSTSTNHHGTSTLLGLASHKPPKMTANTVSLTTQDMSHEPKGLGGGCTSSLLIPSASMLLDPVHYFLQSECIEVFATTEDDLTAQGRGARPSKVGQVGLRCYHCKDIPKKNLAKQAVCFPSKRANIFESVRNFQRTHINACQCVPEQMKAKYKTLNDQGGLQKRSQKYMKAYYAEAASELGIIDSSKGLVFGAPPNKSGFLSERLQALIQAAENPSVSSSFWKAYSSGEGRKDKAMEMRKFEHIASEDTRTVIIDARKEPTPFVRPEDFAGISDFEFLLFHQVAPCAPPAAALKRKGVDAEQVVKRWGFCCKHCDRASMWKNDHKGHFPVDVNTLADTSFLQKMLNHFLKCPHVPQEVKNAFDELKRLAEEQDTTAKRGPRKRFIEKIWERMKGHYGLDSDQ